MMMSPSSTPSPTPPPTPPPLEAFTSPNDNVFTEQDVDQEMDEATEQDLIMRHITTQPSLLDAELEDDEDDEEEHHSTVAAIDGADDDHEDSENKGDELIPGDHVYHWCSLIGIPGMFQHHGIVIQVNEDEVTIADFSNLIREGGNQKQKVLFSFQRAAARGTLQRSTHKTTDNNKSRRRRRRWHKVEYQASWWKRSVWRSGTCTAIASDPPGLVLARAHYLLDHPEVLPQYHLTKANCECVAVWVKTGTWATLQASSWLHMTAAGQVKSAATLAAYASTQTVTVPAAGMWGWFGFTTKVSLLSMHPYLLPVIAGYGVLTVGGPVWVLLRARHFWNGITSKLNDSFWASAVDTPEVFVECITEWSEVPSNRAMSSSISNIP